MDFNIKGTYINWKKLDQIREDRWDDLGSGDYYCKLHDTYFRPDGSYNEQFQDAEPCWQCYQECEVEIIECSNAK